MTSTSLIFNFMAPVYKKTSPFADTIVRFMTGAILMPHGAQKLFGLFGGYGLEATGQFFQQNMGFSNGYLVALASGSIEFFGGLFLALGLFTRLSSAAIAILLLVALTFHTANGFFWTSGGYEYPLLWAIIAFSYMLKGGGAYSLDRVIGKEF